MATLVRFIRASLAIRRSLQVSWNTPSRPMRMHPPLNTAPTMPTSGPSLHDFRRSAHFAHCFFDPEPEGNSDEVHTLHPVFHGVRLKIATSEGRRDLPPACPRVRRGQSADIHQAMKKGRAWERSTLTSRPRWRG
ncbi:hypothetical protein BREVUG8_110241 [Brevundimonas sp. G8]|nr:hypothetical protein BREVUG8_110241 [Brevundimonas sp. G8]